jgi:peroxiredoxin
VQLVELQGVSANLAQHGIALFAISYDSVDALRAFADKNGITFPLLADEGSHVIRALGMLDDHLDEHHAQFGGVVREDQRGVCYPGVFLLDEQGVVDQRRFQDNYRLRESAAGLLEHALGIASPAPSPVVEFNHERVHVRAHSDSPTYWRYQRLNIVVELDIAEGCHLYAAPTPEGYVPLSIEVVADSAVVGQPVWPASTPFRVPSLDEEFGTYEGTLRVVVPFEFVIQRGEPLGDRTVAVTVRYQACTATTCDLPRQATFELLVKERSAAD